MSSLKFDRFDFDVSDADAKRINELLLNTQISNCHKKYVISIIPFLNGTTLYNGRVTSNISVFLDFFLNCYVSKSFSLTSLLDKINCEIRNIDDEEHSLEDKKKLREKIMTFVIAITNDLQALDKSWLYQCLIAALDKEKFAKLISDIGVKWISVLNEILNVDIDKNRQLFISDLFLNAILKANVGKRDIILEVVLNNQLGYDVMHGLIYPHLWNVLTNEDVLALDDEKYKKVVELVISGMNAYILDIAFQNPSVTLSKKIAIIDYYSCMTKCWIKTPLLIDRAVLRECRELEIFNVVYSDGLIAMSDEEYLNTLNSIKNSKRPVSYSKVLSCSSIGDDQKTAALSMMESSSITEDVCDINANRDNYKYAVSLAAVSPVLASLSIKRYIEILQLISGYCECMNVACCERNFAVKEEVGEKILGITKILNNAQVFGANELRVLLAINFVVTSNSKSMAIEMANFVQNVALECYTDGEYICVLNIVRDSFGQSHFSAVKRLLSNSNVFYMSKPDKNKMFDVARTRDIDSILSLAKTLDSQEKVMHNTFRFSTGVPDDVLEQVTGFQKNRKPRVNDK